MINTHWGGVTENNHFGTHEFMDLVGQLGASAYISGNVGSGSVQEMMEWVESLTSAADSPLARDFFRPPEAPGRGRYSYRSASMGSRRAARRAGQ